MIALLVAQLLAQAPASVCLDTYKQLFPADCAAGATACPANEAAACKALDQRNMTCVERLRQLRGPAGCGAAGCTTDEAKACHSIMIEGAENYLAVLRGHSSTRAAATEPVIDPNHGVPGTPAQTSSAASDKPVPLYGISTGSSTAPAPPDASGAPAPAAIQTLTITLNPGGLATTDDPQDFVRWARLLDFSVVLPAAVTTGAAVSFAGLRGRADFVGLLNPGQVESLGKAVIARSDEEAAAIGKFMEALQAALDGLQGEAKRKCVDALLGGGDLIAACGGALREPSEKVSQAVPDFRAKLDAFREIVDNNQLGVTGQLDVPFTRTAGIPLRAALSLVGGVHPIDGSAGRLGVGLNAAADYFYVPPSRSSLFGGFVAAAVDYDVALAKILRIYATFGLKAHGQFGQAAVPPVLLVDPTHSPGNYLMAEGGLRIMLGASGFAFSTKFSWGLLGDLQGKPAVSTSFDYVGKLSNANDAKP